MDGNDFILIIISATIRKVECNHSRKNDERISLEIALSTDYQYFFVAEIRRFSSGQVLFSTKRHYVSHKRTIKEKVSGPCYLSKSFSQVATEIL